MKISAEGGFPSHPVCGPTLPPSTDVDHLRDWDSERRAYRAHLMLTTVEPAPSAADRTDRGA